MKKYLGTPGFTMIELLMVLALSITLLAASMGNLTKFFYTAAVDSETQSLVSMLRLAKSKAMSEVNDNKYKLVYTLTSFSVQDEADTVTIENHRMDPKTRLTAGGSIIFNKITGIASSCPCSITITYFPNTTFASKTVLVSGQGLITIQ